MAAVAYRDEVLHRYSSLDELANVGPAVLRPALATVNDDLFAASEREARAGAKIIVWPEAGAGTLVDDKAGLIARAAALARATTSICTSGSACSAAARPTCGTRPSSSILPDRWSGPTTKPAPSRAWTNSPQVTEKCRPSTRRTASWPISSASTLTSPGLARQRGREGVDIMLVASNDWREFGAVHTQKATLRAIENGDSLVRQDTKGLAQVVDLQGHVLAASDYFTTDQQTMVAYVPAQGERTIYAMVGDVFAWLSVAALAVLIGATRLVRQSAPRIPPESSSTGAALTSTGARK